MVVQDRRAARREATIREILDAAWAQCAAEGIGRLSLRRLAESVGMKAPSLYVYFESKNALYDALFADAATEFQHLYAEAISATDAEEAWRAALECYLRFAVQNPAKFQLHFQRPVPDFEPSEHSFQIARDTYALFVDSLRRGVEAGLFDESILDQRSLDLLTALSSGLASQQLSNEPNASFDEGRWTSLVPDAIDLLKLYFSPKSQDERKER